MQEVLLSGGDNGERLVCNDGRQVPGHRGRRVERLADHGYGQGMLVRTGDLVVQGFFCHSEEVKDPAEHERVGQPHQRSIQHRGAPGRVHGLQPPDLRRLDAVHDMLRGERVKPAEVEHFTQVVTVPVPVVGRVEQLARHDFAHHRCGESLHSAQRDLGRPRVTDCTLVNAPIRLHQIPVRYHLQHVFQPSQSRFFVTAVPHLQYLAQHGPRPFRSRWRGRRQQSGHSETLRGRR